MPCRKAVNFIAFFILAAVTAPAQSPSPPPGGAPPQEPENPVMRLGLKDAIAIALAPEGNVRIRLAEEYLLQAHARSARSRAALLPNLDSTVGYQNQTRNLAAFGIRIQLPIPGFSFPELVGPYNVFDARATATQSLFNFSSIRRYQASRAGVGQAEAELENTQDLVRAQVAQAYLASLRARATLEAAQANVELAKALLKLAEDQKAAGTGTGIEITRARVQLANEQQNLLVAENQQTRSHLELLRVMGVDLSVSLELTGDLAYVPVESVTVQQAMETALQERADWKAQQKRLENSSLLQSAAKMERLPSVGLFGDYGTIGTGFDHAIPTRTYGITVKIPLFDGGRLEAQRAESSSQYRQEVSRRNDLRTQINLEIRLALDSLKSADQQVRAAEEGLVLAENELAQAERRFRAGVGTGLEVTDAQTRLERARQNRISALFNYNVARIDLGVATGTIRRMVQ